MHVHANHTGDSLVLWLLWLSFVSLYRCTGSWKEKMILITKIRQINWIFKFFFTHCALCGFFFLVHQSDKVLELFTQVTCGMEKKYVNINFYNSLVHLFPRILFHFWNIVLYFICIKKSKIQTCGGPQFSGNHGLRIVGIIIRIHTTKTGSWVSHTNGLRSTEATKNSSTTLL